MVFPSLDTSARPDETTLPSAAFTVTLIRRLLTDLTATSNGRSIRRLDFMILSVPRMVRTRSPVPHRDRPSNGALDLISNRLEVDYPFFASTYREYPWTSPCSTSRCRRMDCPPQQSHSRIRKLLRRKMRFACNPPYGWPEVYRKWTTDRRCYAKLRCNVSPAPVDGVVVVADTLAKYPGSWSWRKHMFRNRCTESSACGALPSCYGRPSSSPNPPRGRAAGNGVLCPTIAIL